MRGVRARSSPRRQSCLGSGRGHPPAPGERPRGAGFPHRLRVLPSPRRPPPRLAGSVRGPTVSERRGWFGRFAGTHPPPPPWDAGRGVCQPAVPPARCGRCRRAPSRAVGDAFSKRGLGTIVPLPRELHLSSPFWKAFTGERSRMAQGWHRRDEGGLGGSSGSGRTHLVPGNTFLTGESDGVRI